jgi:sugar/nucleoside kinase (ribokinase family)
LSPKKKKKVLVVGDLNVDIIGTGLQAFPVLGRETTTKEMRLSLGSSSAILSCGLAKLGVPVTLISKIGKDDFGKYCLQALKANKVKSDNILQDSKLNTGLKVSLNFRNDKAEVTYPGASPHLRYKDIPQKVVRSQDHLHVSSFFMQTDLISFFPKLFQDARRTGMTTSLDPNSDNRNQWNAGIWNCLEFVDILMLNEMEAINITRAKSVNRALELFAQKVPMVVIKLGVKGAVAKSRGQVVQLPAFKVKTIDSTGAGDSFDAGFLFSFLNEFDLRKSLNVANACGALSTRDMGGTTMQGTLKDIQKLIRSRR